MKSIEHLKWRYATKKFDPNKLVSQEHIEGLKQAFNLTATSYGLQPIKMVLIQNKQLQEALVAHSYGQRQVVDASHLLVICIENNIDEAFITQYFKLVKKLRGTSDEVLDSFKESLVKSFSKKEIGEVRAWATNQAYLALGNLLSYCALEKIDSCPMEGFVPAAYDQQLHLQAKGLTSVLVLPVGYRAADDMFSEMKKVRKDLKESIIEIF